MSGKRLNSFRSGDRSEYLALFILSQVSFVNLIPRQEDFGIIDYFCILTRLEKKKLFPEHGFYVQVKSNNDPVILDGDALTWISHHMQHPLFYLIVDKKNSFFHLYSAMHLWPRIFMDRNLKEIKVKFGGELETKLEPPIDGKYEVNLGNPILSLTLEQLEDKPDILRKVLGGWIACDKKNISWRDNGALVTSCVVEHEDQYPTTYHESLFDGVKYGQAEAAVVQTLVALLNNYIRFEGTKSESAKALIPYLDTLMPHMDFVLQNRYSEFKSKIECGGR